MLPKAASGMRDLLVSTTLRADISMFVGLKIFVSGSQSGLGLKVPVARMPPAFVKFVYSGVSLLL